MFIGFLTQNSIGTIKIIIPTSYKPWLNINKSNKINIIYFDFILYE